MLSISGMFIHYICVYLGIHYDEWIRSGSDRLFLLQSENNPFLNGYLPAKNENFEELPLSEQWEIERKCANKQNEIKKEIEKSFHSLYINDPERCTDRDRSVVFYLCNSHIYILSLSLYFHFENPFIYYGSCVHLSTGILLSLSRLSIFIIYYMPFAYAIFNIDLLMFCVKLVTSEKM